MRQRIQSLPRRMVFAIVGMVLALVIVGVILTVVLSPKAPPPNIVTARRGDLSAAVNATGKIRAKKSARLSLPLSGMIASVDKQEGDEVNPGDVIVTLRADETTRRVKQAELNLSSRQLDLARAQGAPRDDDIEIARGSLRKATLTVAALEAVNSASPTPQNSAALESARIDLEIARANFNRIANGPSKEEINALQNSVTIAQLELESVKTALAQTKLTTPFTATVTEINARVGELVGGFSPLATIADLSALEIAAEIDEIDVANAQVGQTVEVRLDAFPGEKFTGKLTRLFPVASTARGSTVYNAVVEFDPRDIKVRVGMGANLRILTLEKKGALLVPNRALKNVGSRKAVRVVAPGEPRDVLVEVGVTDGNNTEIVSGLNEGDQVLVN